MVDGIVVPGSEGWVRGKPVSLYPPPVPADWCWHRPESAGQAPRHPPTRGLYQLCRLCGVCPPLSDMRSSQTCAYFSASVARPAHPHPRCRPTTVSPERWSSSQPSSSSQVACYPAHEARQGALDVDLTVSVWPQPRSHRVPNDGNDQRGQECMPALKGVRKPLVTLASVLRMQEVDVKGRERMILNPTKLRDHPINLVPLDGPKVYKWDDRAPEGSVFLLQNTASDLPPETLQSGRLLVGSGEIPIPPDNTTNTQCGRKWEGEGGETTRKSSSAADPTACHLDDIPIGCSTQTLV
ncbi:hypothetical protein PIB30_020168 [Stylosanthes scabra]|uniref:Uncharacterized protein n=1 Tax=Stylosanthes scabra TaxID=79078 RepID=A0ABU6Q894_9FABA|nr:hypothetical protein [Stylosanthes scabra]